MDYPRPICSSSPTRPEKRARAALSHGPSPFTPLSSTEVDRRTTALQRTVADLQVADAWALTRLASRGHPPRRFLPTAGNRGPNAQATLVVGVLRSLLLLVAAGSAQAEPLLLFFPRLLLAKGCSPAAQLDALLKSKQPATPDARSTDPVQGWLHRLRAAMAEPAQAKLAGLLERGPDVFVPAQQDVLDASLQSQLFPPVKEAAQEQLDAQRLAVRARCAGSRVPITAKDIRSWAACHRTSSGGVCGWTGSLLLAIDAADRQVHQGTSVLELLAENWSRAPHEWLDAQAATVALRHCDGWLIKRDGKPPRPIAAPQVIRRIRSAIDAKKARPLVAAFCEPKGQLGASGDARQLCYAMVPQLVVHTGGTTVSADRSQSFQRFDRSALMAALSDTLTEAEATGRTEEAAALVRLAADTLLDSAVVPRTYVMFGEQKVSVPSLPQGCTLSPTMEAITLAGAIQSTNAPQGAVMQGNHDDLQLSWYGELDAQLRLPNTEAVGGHYNNSKAVAVGARASAAAQDAGLAATTATATTVWGRPVGDVLEWMRTTWLPKWRARISNIERVALLDVDLAISCAIKTGGPGSAAQHWLRGTPPQLLRCPLIQHELAEADRDWVRLFVSLAKVEPTADRVRQCQAAVFSHSGLRQQSAAAVAAHAPYAGVEKCIGTLLTIAHERGIDPRPWGPLLELRQLTDAPAATLSPLDRERVRTEAAENTNRAAPVLDAPSPMPNLFAMALQDPGELAAALNVSHVARTPRVLSFALARTLRLPIWNACTGNTTTTPPTNCACGAIYPSSDSGLIVDWSSGSARTFYLDDHGEHMASCRELPTSCCYKRRHDPMVSMCASIARATGIEATTHDMPLFASNGQRPADWMEDISADKGGYICCDLTIVGTDLNNAVDVKQRKYAQGLKENPLLSLNVVALRTNGEFHSEVLKPLRRWHKNMITTQSKLGKPTGNCLTNVSAAFARAFASTMAHQAQTFLRHITGALPGRKGYNKRVNPYPTLRQVEKDLIQSITQDALVANGD